MIPPPSNLRTLVIEQARSTASPTRAEHVRRQVLWLGLYLLLFVAVSALRGSSPWLARPRGYMLVSALAFGAFISFGFARLAGFLTTPLGPTRAGLRVLARAVLPSLAVAALLANLAAPATVAWPGHGLGRHLLCPALLLLTGTVFASLLARVLRGADPVQPGTTAAAIGATAGATAALAVTLQCHLADPLHALATHVLPVALVVLLARKLSVRIAP